MPVKITLFGKISMCPDSSYTNPIQIPQHHELNELFEAKSRHDILRIQRLLIIVGVSLLLWAFVPTTHVTHHPSSLPSEETFTSVTLNGYDLASAPKITAEISTFGIFTYFLKWINWFSSDVQKSPSPTHQSHSTAACVLG